jgi:3-oxoacyl-[acyl-carrier protein] reductase
VYSGLRAPLSQAWLRASDQCDFVHRPSRQRGAGTYAAAKAGIIGFTKTAAKELAAFGVTVNAISPNADTRKVQSIPAEKRAELEALIPQRRFGSGREIAAGVAFLASEEAGYITGAVLPIDGGLSM